MVPFSNSIEVVAYPIGIYFLNISSSNPTKVAFLSIYETSKIYSQLLQLFLTYPYTLSYPFTLELRLMTNHMSYSDILGQIYLVVMQLIHLILDRQNFCCSLQLSLSKYFRFDPSYGSSYSSISY